MLGIITDALDTVALLLLAAGLGFQASGWMTVAMVGSHGFNQVATGAGLFVAGAVILGGSWLAAKRAEPVEVEPR